MTEEEAALARFLITRYREARADPGPKTLDALGHALTVALRRVRAALEICFSDPQLEADVRRELLVVYGSLDRYMEGFKHARADDPPSWLAAAEGLIQRLEAGYAMAEQHRPQSARDALAAVDADASSTHSDAGATQTPDFEDRKTEVFVRSGNRPDSHASGGEPTTQRYG